MSTQSERNYDPAQRPWWAVVRPDEVGISDVDLWGTWGREIDGNEVYPLPADVLLGVRPMGAKLHQCAPFELARADRLAPHLEVASLHG